jgi:hypothetical protein
LAHLPERGAIKVNGRKTRESRKRKSIAALREFATLVFAAGHPPVST